MPSAPNPLATGNRLQRAYYRWAEPHYQRIGAKDPALREQIELTDAFLYGREGTGAWIGWLGAVLGTGAGLQATGMPLWFAALFALLLGLALAVLVLNAWLQPHKLRSAPRRPRLLVALTLGVVSAGLLGFVVGHALRKGELVWAEVLPRLARFSEGLAVGLLASLAGLALLTWVVSRASLAAQATRLAQAQLVAERDAAARQALEADLRLLQAQIHPHFVFNTLATLQHWVDKQDERAGPLLRELTGFLRRSTEMLGRVEVPLAEELQAVRHYLAILGQRMPARLAWAVDLDDALAERPVPPGLVLTLVENAIEHGLEPKIGGGRLTVNAAPEGSGWRLRVADDGLGLAPDSEDGLGLGNVRRRLQLRHGDRASLRLSARPEGGTLAEVRFP